MKQDRFCSKCIHFYVPPEHSERSPLLYAMCAKTVRHEPVVGNLEWTPCGLERGLVGDRYCGPEGKFFEPVHA